jgi:hypothetical protein
MNTHDLKRLDALETMNRNRELLTDEEYMEFKQLLLERVREFIRD